jgi:hypothetical protein
VAHVLSRCTLFGSSNFLQVCACQLFDVPADDLLELRNNIYDFLIGEEIGIRRLIPRSQTPKTKIVQEVLFPLASVCKKLRAESFPKYLACLNAGLQTTDLELFQRTFCRNIRNGQVVRRQHPQAITIYGFPPNDQRWFHAPIDLLPLFKLRLECPDMSCMFLTDPRVEWEQCSPPPDTDRGRTVSDGVVTRCEDLTSFLTCNDEKWVDLIQGTKLANVFVHFWLPINVDLVFREQPPGRHIDATGVRCYIPDTRRFGLEGVYTTTKLEMKMRMKA